MTKNNILKKIREKSLVQGLVAGQISSDLTFTTFTAIENGYVLPTKESLEALCFILDCSPSDLYNIEDIDLASVMRETAEIEPVKRRSGRQHDGMVEFRAWLRPYEKAAIESAVRDLGYRSLAEWIREMIRNTVARNKRIPKQTENKPSEVITV